MNRKLSRRLLMLLLAMILSIGALGMAVSATDTGTTANLPEPIRVTHTNPLYDIKIDLPDLDAYADASTYAVSEYHKTPAAAAPVIRAGMLERKARIEVGYLIPVNQFTSEGVDKILIDLMDATFVHTGKSTEGDYLRWHWGGSGAEFAVTSVTSDNKYYNTVITLVSEYYTTKSQEQFMTQQTTSLLNSLNLSGSDYTKVKTIYDWICSNVAYDYDNVNNSSYKLQYSAYAALVNRTAVCQGYAQLLYRLALEAGIDCRVIVGTSYGENHAWNIIKLGIYYYNLDSTWDAGANPYGYFLTSDANFNNHTREAEYRTSAFYAKYPMGPENYIPGQDERLFNATRLAGSNRHATSLLVADQMKKVLGVSQFDAVIIADGYGFADALAGSYLSTQKTAPIFLSYGKGGKYAYLDEDNIAYINSNLKPGGTVYILGGEKAVPVMYEEALSQYNVKRLGGENRFETNLLILKEAGVHPGQEILVCTGTEFADSLSASAAGLPILLVYEKKGALYDFQAEYLASLGGQNRFCIIGGEAAVGTKLQKEVSKYGTVERLAGANRFVTSVLVAERYFPNATSAVVAYGWNFPDGLCGGALAYAMKAPLILTYPTAKYYAIAAEYTNRKGISSGIVLGGETLIPNEAGNAIFRTP